MEQNITIQKDSPFRIMRMNDGSISVTYEQPLNKWDAVYCSTPTSRWVCFVKKIKGNQAFYSASYNLTAKLFLTNEWFRYEYIRRIATEKEKTKLLQAIDRNGFVWDSETCTLSEKKDKYIVPEVINICKIQVGDENNIMGDGLVIASSDMKKVMFAGNDGYGIFDNKENLFSKVKCRMIPCNYSELKWGDTAYMGGNYSDPYKTSFYVKKLLEGHVYMNNGSAIQCLNPEGYKWYKIVPI